MPKDTDSIYDPAAWSRLPEYGALQQQAPRDLPLYALLKRDMQMGDRILDVGCGSGRLANVLKEYNYIKYTGIDITPSYIELAKMTFPKYAWQVGDCRDLPYDAQSFDRVWSCNLLIHLAWDDIQVALDEMKRVAKEAIYLISLFEDRSGVSVIESDGIRFLSNTINFKDLVSDGWVLAETFLKADRGATVAFEDESYAVLRRKTKKVTKRG